MQYSLRNPRRSRFLPDRLQNQHGGCPPGKGVCLSSSEASPGRPDGGIAVAGRPDVSPNPLCDCPWREREGEREREREREKKRERERERDKKKEEKKGQDSRRDADFHRLNHS